MALSKSRGLGDGEGGSRVEEEREGERQKDTKNMSFREASAR